LVAGRRRRWACPRHRAARIITADARKPHARKVADPAAHLIERAGWAEPDRAGRMFARQTRRRKVKTPVGLVLIDRVRNNPGLFRWIPKTIGYVRDALAGAGARFTARRAACPL
jgi:hypothetical protein